MNSSFDLQNFTTEDDFKKGLQDILDSANNVIKQEKGTIISQEQIYKVSDILANDLSDNGFNGISKEIDELSNGIGIDKNKKISIDSDQVQNLIKTVPSTINDPDSANKSTNPLDVIYQQACDTINSLYNEIKTTKNLWVKIRNTLEIAAIIAAYLKAKTLLV